MTPFSDKAHLIPNPLDNLQEGLGEETSKGTFCVIGIVDLLVGFIDREGGAGVGGRSRRGSLHQQPGLYELYAGFRRSCRHLPR